MCESYSRSLLRVSVAQICQALGWDSVQVTACDLLTDVLHRYLQQLCRGAHRYSELYGRTDPVLDDVGQAFKLMGVNLHELEDYIHNIEPVTFPHQIPSFPVSKNNVLQFPPPGSKDAEDRKEYIPDYLPLIISSQEEEEEEQVPTDGGTSAEAMQVPYEEGEMEEDETINDENYLSKRPLDSPEAEMPFPKRQRLANSKGDILDGTLEPREPLSSINTQKVSPMLSPTHIPDNSDLTISSSEPVMLSPILKPQTPSKPLESKALTSKTKSKSSPGQKTKSPKSTALGSPMRSPKNALKDKKSPGRAKSPKSPKSPKTSAPAIQPTVKSETPSRTPLATVSEKIGRENIQVKPSQASQDSEKVNPENPSKKPSVTDNTIEDSIDAVIARACAEQEPDPFEFSSGSESEGDVFTSPKRLTIAEPGTPKVSAANSSLGKMCSTPLPASGGTSSSDISWTMDDSINEVIRKVNQETPPSVSISQPCFSSPSASPPTPEPLVKTFEDKAKLASPVELKKKAKKELKTKTKKKDKEKQKDKDKSKEKNKDKNKEKDKDSNKDSKLQWKDSIKDDDGELPRLKSKDLNDSEQKPKQKESSGKKEKEKHKDKKKDKEKGRKDKEKKEKGKDKNKEEKLKNAQPTPVVLPSKDLSLAILSTPNAVRLPSLMPSISPLSIPEKVTEDREKTKEKDKKKEKKEKKKKKDKEKVKEKEKEKKEKEKKDKDKEKHKHDKQAKVELSIPAPSPVIPRLTLRVGAGQDTIVISKVVSAPDAKAAPPPSLPKSPLPAPSPAPAPVLVVPPPVPAPPAPAAASPAPNPTPPAPGPNAGNSKTPYRSVVTETVSTYVIRDEWGNQIWICPGCNKLDDGSPMIGCDGCDDWYHWPCVGLTAEPEVDQWFCTKCDSKKKDKKHKKRKHKAH
ncbi:transcription initiation factor TFIID subunit 3 isoform X1 [Ranitomeya variabilis]|uniref:transcription initiation factor TFIID subunit 3 isoform X1 n=2 Tax=Ranitomeya variabilis TaxID=490064 RepID=UPI0040579C91